MGMDKYTLYIQELSFCFVFYLDKSNKNEHLRCESSDFSSNGFDS